MQHRAHARDGQVGLEVGLVVPHERADAVALLHAEPGQRRRQLIGTVGHLGERGLDVAVAGEGDDLAVGVNVPPVLERSAEASADSPASC